MQTAGPRPLHKLPFAINRKRRSYSLNASRGDACCCCCCWCHGTHASNKYNKRNGQTPHSLTTGRIRWVIAYLLCWDEKGRGIRKGARVGCCVT
jgi:hypothetical protein